METIGDLIRQGGATKEKLYDMLIERGKLLVQQEARHAQEVAELGKKIKGLEEYNTPEFLEYLHSEGVNIYTEYNKNSAISYAIMIIGFYKGWLKKLLPEHDAATCQIIGCKKCAG